jgi:hypothetical protein
VIRKLLLATASLICLTGVAGAQVAPAYQSGRITAGHAIIGGAGNTIQDGGAVNVINTSSENDWTGLQTFATNPVFSACTGFLIGNGGNAATCDAIAPGAMISFAPLGTSPILPTAQQVFAQTINAESYGYSNSTQVSTCFATVGQNTITLAVGNDFAVGEGLKCLGAGPSYTLMPPPSYGISQGGTVGTTSITYAISLDDGNGGLSEAQDVNITNGNAVQSLLNPVTISTTPTVRGLPLHVWKNINNAGWNYIGSALPTYSVTISTAGSGFTPGTYWWQATGGTCTYEPFGKVTVNSVGAVSAITVFSRWSGCTIDPVFKMPKAAGSGTGAAVALTYKWSFVDFGLTTASNGAIQRPAYVPATPTLNNQADWLVAQITAISGVTATINTTVGSTVEQNRLDHDETNALTLALNAASVSTLPNTAVTIPCGPGGNISGTLNINFANVSLTQANASSWCGQIFKWGVGDVVDIATGLHGNAITNLKINGANQASGWAILALDDTHLSLKNLAFTNTWGGFSARNPVDLVADTIFGVGLWGYGSSDFDLENTSTTSNNGPVDIRNLTSTDNAISNTVPQGGTSRAGFVINGLNNVVGSNNSANGVEGYGWHILNTGVANNFTSQFDGAPLAPLTTQVAAGSSATLQAGFQIEDCWRCTFSDSVNSGGQSSAGVFIGSDVSDFQWNGGSVINAGTACFDVGGQQSRIIGASIKWCSNSGVGGTTGASPGVTIEPTAQNVLISNNTIGDTTHPTWLATPVKFQTASSTATAAWAAAATSITATANTGAVLPGMLIYDTSLGEFIGTVSTYSGTAITLSAPGAAHASSGSADSLVFAFGSNLATDNVFAGAVSEAISGINTQISNLSRANLGEALGIPTFASGACGGAIGVANNVAAFTFTTGSGTCGSTATLNMPAEYASNGWICSAIDEAAAGAFRIQQSSDTLSSVVLTNYSIGTTPAAANYTVSRTVKVTCTAY